MTINLLDGQIYETAISINQLLSLVAFVVHCHGGWFIIKTGQFKCFNQLWNLANTLSLGAAA
jgi:hypothetical protein